MGELSTSYCKSVCKLANGNNESDSPCRQGAALGRQSLLWVMVSPNKHQQKEEIMGAVFPSPSVTFNVCE